MLSCRINPGNVSMIGTKDLSGGRGSTFIVLSGTQCGMNGSPIVTKSTNQQTTYHFLRYWGAQKVRSHPSHLCAVTER